MSRKKTQPKKNVVPDPKFNSTIIPKLINNIMYDGKRGVAAKIVYDAIDKIKRKTKGYSDTMAEAMDTDTTVENVLPLDTIEKCVGKKVWVIISVLLF